MDTYALYFLISFAVGIVWFRLLFLCTPKSFEKPLVRSALKLRWHHLHWGAIFIVCGVLLLLRGGETPGVFVLLGLGLGFVFDLFVPSLLLETDRTQELIVYRKSLWPTLCIGAVIVLLVLALMFF